MITIVAECKLKSGKKTEFLAVAKTLIQASRGESGNGSYHLYQSKDDENILTFIENWRNDDAIAQHGKSAHFQSACKAFVPYLDGDMKIRLYEDTGL